MALLFDDIETPKPAPVTPIQAKRDRDNRMERDGRAAGMSYIAPEREGLAAHVITLLYQAGKVSRDGATGGYTLQELAPAVAARRGKPTKETSLTQTLKDLRAHGYAIKTQIGRKSVSGIKCSVFVHKLHWESWMGSAAHREEA